MYLGGEADCMETKKILGVVLCISIMVLVGCVKNEDEKFIPIELAIESTDLTRIGNDEFTIPAEGGSFTICSAERGVSFMVNWLEFDGVEYYLTDEEVDAGYYDNDWVTVVLLETSPVKYEIVLKANTSRERNRVRIGVNCFHYSYRILSIVQQSGE